MSASLPSCHAARRSVLLAVACVCLPSAACARLSSEQSRGLRVIPTGAAVAPSAPERSSFSVPLVAADLGMARVDGKPQGSASISVRDDNVVVYMVEIDNIDRQTFTQAQVVRVSADSSAEVIATLFADVMLRGARISVRGTASLSRMLPPDALLAHVREHPGEYRVVVRGARHPAGSLTGWLGNSSR